MRVCRLLLPWLLLACLLLSSLALPPSTAAGQRLCFPETNLCSENAFLTFWSSHGAIPVLGLPISSPITDENGRVVQFYERAVLEWHGQNPPAAQVLLAHLGRQHLGDSPLRDTPPGPCDAAGCRLFPETNHSVRGLFLTHWSNLGGLATFGLPLTEEFAGTSEATGQPIIIQYFERTRLELHHTPQPMILGTHLGTATWQSRADLHRRRPVSVPDYSESIIPRPGQLTIPAIGVNAPVEEVGLEASGEMGAPHNATSVGWFNLGSRPGEPGNAVLAGHVDFRGVGPAVFWSLRSLTPGAEIWVRDATGRERRFVVEEVATYRTNDAPLNRIFGPTGDVRLNLITCTGNFSSSSRSYDSRLVVYTRWDGTVR